MHVEVVGLLVEVVGGLPLMFLAAMRTRKFLLMEGAVVAVLKMLVLLEPFMMLFLAVLLLTITTDQPIQILF